MILPEHDSLAWRTGSNPTLHPGRRGAIFRDEREIAYYGEIHPAGSCAILKFRAGLRC